MKNIALDVLERGLDEICQYAFDTRLEKKKMRSLIRQTCNAIFPTIKRALEDESIKEKAYAQGYATCLANAVSLESHSPEDIGGGFTISDFKRLSVAKYDLNLLEGKMK